jgi:hypothetical protein
MATYWVSFATKEKFLGVAIVDIPDPSEDTSRLDIIYAVVDETIARGCNPRAGSVQAHRVPAGEIPDSFKNRLLGKDEVDYLNTRALH